MADVVLCSGDISPRGKIQVMCTQIMPPRGVELARLQPCFAAKISVVVPVAVSRPSPSRALCGLASVHREVKCEKVPSRAALHQLNKHFSAFYMRLLFLI